MSDIAQFILERVVEDEAVATAALEDRPPKSTPANFEQLLSDYDSGWSDMTTSTYEQVKQWSPERALAECAAKRAIVAIFDPPNEWRAMCDDDVWPIYDLVLLELARIWSAHPDFDPAWK